MHNPTAAAQLLMGTAYLTGDTLDLWRDYDVHFDGVQGMVKFGMLGLLSLSLFGV